MSWVIIPAVVSAVLGLINGARGLRSMRSKEPTRAEISWKQAPLSPWRYETLSMVPITLHSLGLLCITAFTLLSVAHNNAFFSLSRIPAFLISAFAFFAIFFTTYSSAVMVAYHFTQQWISPITYGISGDGMLYGNTLIPWKSYSHYEVGPEPGLISLYSSYSPLLRTWVLQPPSDSFASVLGIIQKHVRSIPPTDDSIPWQHSPVTLILEMIVLVAGTLLLLLWGWIQNPPWVWMYALIAFVAVQYLGIRLITVFDGRGDTFGAPDMQESGK